MKIKRDTILQWIVIVMMIVPTMIYAKLRLHHKNFGLFVLLSILSVAVVWILYFLYLKKTNYKCENDEKTKEEEI